MSRKKDLSGHHILPTSRGGATVPDNILDVSTKAHRAWHLLFGNATPVDATKIIWKYWTEVQENTDVVISKDCVGYYKPKG